MASLVLVLLWCMPIAGRIWMEWEGREDCWSSDYFCWSSRVPLTVVIACQGDESSESVDVLTDSVDVHLRSIVCSLLDCIPLGILLIYYMGTRARVREKLVFFLIKASLPKFLQRQGGAVFISW